MINDHRIIATEGGAHVPEHVRLWKGSSVGRWDGDTLVVETKNFTAETAFRGSGENMVLVERFTRVDDDTVLYAFEVHDPRTYVEPWGGEIPMERLDDHVYEYACHEGNYGFEGVLRGARYGESQAAGGGPARP